MKKSYACLTVLVAGCLLAVSAQANNCQYYTFAGTVAKGISHGYTWGDFGPTMTGKFTNQGSSSVDGSAKFSVVKVDDPSIKISGTYTFTGEQLKRQVTPTGYKYTGVIVFQGMVNGEYSKVVSEELYYFNQPNPDHPNLKASFPVRWKGHTDRKSVV